MSRPSRGKSGDRRQGRGGGGYERRGGYGGGHIDSGRSQRAEMAKETLCILDEGGYTNSAGKRIELKDLIANCVDKTELYSVAALEDKRHVTKQQQATVYEVADETTLDGIARMVKQGYSVCALNFASAKNPGGGFENGAEAQEESLARSSALFPCINQPRIRKMYDNRKDSSCVYTHTMSYAPAVPIIRDSNGSLLEAPHCAAFITAPAVNAGIVRQRIKGDAASVIQREMFERLRRVLTIAAMHGHDALVLGAWGCGVFRNDAADVASYFRTLLASDKHGFRGAFKHVVFSILGNKHNLLAFQTQFADLNNKSSNGKTEAKNAEPVTVTASPSKPNAVKTVQQTDSPSTDQKDSIPAASANGSSWASKVKRVST